MRRDLKRVQQQQLELERDRSEEEETEAALQEAWTTIREERALRQQAEERLLLVMDFLRQQGVDIPQCNAEDLATVARQEDV